MRKVALTLSLFAAAAPFLGAVPACNGSDAATNDEDAGDAGIGSDQPLGAPCDPSLAEPCLPGVPCYTVTCDAIQGCVQAFTGCAAEDSGSPLSFDDAAVSNDAGPSSIPCNTTNDCPALYDDAGHVTSHPEVCGFPIIEGCEAAGICVVPEPPMRPNGTVYMGCSCDGQPVPYVTDNETSEPVTPDGTPCPVDAGPADAGPGDAAPLDSAADAAGPLDAGRGDATADADMDATSNPADAGNDDAAD